MSAPLLMICASFLFATMGVCVKFASDTYGAGEIVMYRGLVGVIGIALLARARGTSLRTKVPMMHAWRSIVGVSALTMWFYAIGHMPLATAVTLNYMSSVWMALFLIGGAVVGLIVHDDDRERMREALLSADPSKAEPDIGCLVAGRHNHRNARVHDPGLHDLERSHPVRAELQQDPSQKPADQHAPDDAQQHLRHQAASFRSTGRPSRSRDSSE